MPFNGTEGKWHSREIGKEEKLFFHKTQNRSKCEKYLHKVTIKSTLRLHAIVISNLRIPITLI